MWHLLRTTLHVFCLAAELVTSELAYSNTRRLNELEQRRTWGSQSDGPEPAEAAHVARTTTTSSSSHAAGARRQPPSHDAK